MAKFKSTEVFQSIEAWESEASEKLEVRKSKGTAPRFQADQAIWIKEAIAGSYKPKIEEYIDKVRATIPEVESEANQEEDQTDDARRKKLELKELERAENALSEYLRYASH